VLVGNAKGQAKETNEGTYSQRSVRQGWPDKGETDVGQGKVNKRTQSSKRPMGEQQQEQTMKQLINRIYWWYLSVKLDAHAQQCERLRLRHDKLHRKILAIYEQ
jgi:hypothetical protein